MSEEFSLKDTSEIAENDSHNIILQERSQSNIVLRNFCSQFCLIRWKYSQVTKPFVGIEPKISELHVHSSIIHHLNFQFNFALNNH